MTYPPVVQFETRQREVEERLAMMQVSRAKKSSPWFRRLRRSAAKRPHPGRGLAAHADADA
jgi:hypothetical protein